VKSSSILDIFGSIILLAAIAVVVKNPQIVNAIGTNFNRALGTALKA